MIEELIAGVFPGGASRGANQVGMLKAAVEENPDFNLDIVLGISVGAVTGVELCMHENFKDAVDSVVKKWLAFDTSDVHKHHLPFSYLHGLWTPNLRDTSPLVKKMHREVDAKRLASSGRDLHVAAWSTRTRKLSWFKGDHPEVTNAVLASSAMPLFFAPIDIEGEQFVDAGIDTQSGIKKAIELGATKIYVFMTQPDPRSTEYNEEPWGTVIDAGMVTLETLVNGVLTKDLKIAELYNRLVAAGVEKKKRYVEIEVISPIAPSPSSPLDFSNDPVREMIGIGEKSWKAAS